jgi:hypothetical protein
MHDKMAIMDAMPVDSDESDTECVTKNDEFWSKINLDPLQLSTHGSKLACSQPIADKRAKHKLVERRRRDRTRAFVEQLQSVLPNIEQRRQNPNVNVILEKALDYLHSIKGSRGDDSSEYNDPIAIDGKRSNLDVVQIFLAKVENSTPIDDITSRKYVFSFEKAPFGIVISRIDGVFVKANEFFRNLFNFPQGAPLMVTMFSLTASQDLAVTMKVCIHRRARHASSAPIRSSLPKHLFYCTRACPCTLRWPLIERFCNSATIVQGGDCAEPATRDFSAIPPLA